MHNKTATLIGATGLIGSHLLELLRSDGQFNTIRLLLRRPLGLNDPAIQEIVLDFGDTDTFKKAVEGSDAVFCTVGTTQNKVKGDMTAYRKVDYDIPVNAAQFCSATGCPHFLLVSSVGADSGSSNFYLKIKGEVEDKAGSLNIPTVTIFRPSMLLGQRNEFRLGERIGQVVMQALAFLIPSNYKPVQARDVARAMLAAAKNTAEAGGVRVWHYREMMSSARA